MSLSALIANCLGERDGLSIARDRSEVWTSWLLPISAASAVGEDPGYDDDFQRMREEANRLSAADTDQVIRLAEKLLKQTCKDVRVASYYLWARLHRDGEAGLADGLNLLAAMVERFGTDLLPARPNSRKMAMEWLASSKVLDSLSLHPEVVRPDAERTVASLVWLAHGLDGLPAEQRADLGALHASLASRLATSIKTTGDGAPHSASHETTGQGAAPVASAVKSARDLLDNGRVLAGYLREQPHGWLAGHRLMKSLRWDTIHQAPPEDASGNTRLAPPRSEYRAQLKRLYLQQSWSELLDQVERIFAESTHHLWLDLQWFLVQALSRQSAPHDTWADIATRDLSMFLERLPGLEELRWSDGSPFADETTREWIARQVQGSGVSHGMPTPSAIATRDVEVLSLESEARAMADSKGVEHALAWLAGRPEIRAGRQHWLLRLLMARVAEHAGKGDLALHLLGELDLTAQHHELRGWEPELHFEVKARLLTLLRLKAQRSAADKSALNDRMEPLLAALVAMDPIRAARLCG